MPGSRYRFRLERVRALRESHEDQAKLALADAMVRHQQCEDRLDEAARRVEAARQAQQRTGQSSADDLIARQAYLERVEAAHRLDLEDLGRHAHAVTGRRSALTQAAQARHTLERLKARGLADHRRDEDRIESAALDEMAMNGYRRTAS